MADQQVRHETPVCVTGASGFIATHVVEQLLAKGYTVRGTVRDASEEGMRKYDYLTQLPGAERLHFFTANLNEPDSFEEAIQGCDCVIHTASPYVLTVEDPQRDLVDPAVQGTLNVLRSCQKAGVKKVVLTSSVAAITDSPINGKVYTESDWNTSSSLHRNPYYYSKTLAERAAWDFVKKLPAEEKFELVVINPFMVIGPSHTQNINPSVSAIKQTLDGSFGGILNFAWGMVDVRDVARAHVLAMEKENAQGRYVCCNETKTMTEVVDYLRPRYPEYGLPTLALNTWWGDYIVRGASYFKPSGLGQYIRTNLGAVPQLDNSKIREELGLEFIPMWQSVTDTCDDLIEKGHVNKTRSSL